MNNQTRLAANIPVEVIAGASPVTNYPDMWWFNCGVERLQHAALENAMFMFVFIQDKQTYVYNISAHLLQELLKKEDSVSIIATGTPRYSLYMEYKTGKVYTSASANKLIIDLSL